LETPTGTGKKYKKYMAKLNNMLYIKVILPPLDKYILFYPTTRHSTFSITPSQIALALKGAPKERPRHL
jgi:hypothetical protein